MRRSVVLPLPLGPRSVTTSPAPIVRSTGDSASTVPNDLATPASSIPTAPDTTAERTDGHRAELVLQMTAPVVPVGGRP